MNTDTDIDSGTDICGIDVLVNILICCVEVVWVVVKYSCQIESIVQIVVA